MKETKPDALFDAWLELPEEQQNRWMPSFKTSSNLSCEKGFRALINEARWQMQVNPEALTNFVETLVKRPMR